MKKDELISVDEAARLLGRSVSRVHQIIVDGKIPVSKREKFPGGRDRFWLSKEKVLTYKQQIMKPKTKSA